MHCKTIAIITATEIKQMGYFSKYTCLVQSIMISAFYGMLPEKLCIFGDFFVSEMQNAEVTKSL